MSSTSLAQWADVAVAAVLDQGVPPRDRHVWELLMAGLNDDLCFKIIPPKAFDTEGIFLEGIFMEDRN